ncbi:MAG TPA: methylmalonyl Co-A mutase-associated GTPase MeaB, partial [Bacteroidia bacterium]|nr:methylmalonyl Co-A mutase-associated GTPase MeaB [Bacteroidia bacterium]
NTPEYYINGILSGDITVLSRAITLIESTKAEHQELGGKVIDGIMHKTGQSFRLGITGVPGVGKSTFIESFGLHLVNNGHRLAVLAIDPSSQKSKGSILGDKTRMEKLSVHANAFIRPSPSSGTLGGVTKNTFETILLCEAAGFDFIIVETVGVGQSEIAVSQMTDFFLLLMLAGAGDELQGIKRGIMEMADALLITKADGNNLQKAKNAKTEYTHALHLFPPSESGWIPKVEICSSIQNEGIKEALQIIESYKNLSITNGYFSLKRKQQLSDWLHYSISEQLKEKFYNHPSIKEELKNIEKNLDSGKINPYRIASELISKWKN